MWSDTSVILKNICGTLTNKTNVLIQIHHQLFNLLPLNVWTSAAWKTEIFCPTSISGILIYLYSDLSPSQRHILILTSQMYKQNMLSSDHVFLRAITIRQFSSLPPGCFTLVVQKSMLFEEVLSCGICQIVTWGKLPWAVSLLRF